MTKAILNEHIERVLGREMAFPDDYCATFVDAVFKDVYGIDFLGNSLRRWNDEAEANKDNPLGLANTAARRIKALGWTRCAPIDAPFASLGIIRGASGHCVGVGLGNGIFVYRYAKGVKYTGDNVIAAYKAPQCL